MSKHDIFYLENIETTTKKNKNYRHVIFTSPNNKMQLVLMSLKPNEEIGMEKHNDADQFIRVEEGEGVSIFGKDKNNLSQVSLKDGSIVLIPANVWHNIKSSDKGLKLYTLYSPAQHKDGLIEPDKPSIQDGGNICNDLYKKKYLRCKSQYLYLKNILNN